MEAIYLITKTHEESGEAVFENIPSTYAANEEDAREILTRTIARIMEWYPDARVTIDDNISTDVRYTNSDGVTCEDIFAIRRVAKFDFAW
jgi:hypothetical protein